jgi:hypothetical protein
MGVALPKFARLSGGPLGNFRFQQAPETYVCNTGRKPPAVAAGPRLHGIDMHKS